MLGHNSASYFLSCTKVMGLLYRQTCLRGAFWPFVYTGYADMPWVQACGPPTKAGKTTISVPSFGAGVLVQTSCSRPGIQPLRVLPASLILGNPKPCLQSWDTFHFPEDGGCCKPLQAPSSTSSPRRSRVISVLRPLETGLASLLCRWA